MERKQFLGTVAGAGAVLAAATAALAGVPSGVPSPATTGTAGSRHGWRRNETKSNENIRMVRKHLDKVIDELQHDQHDYNGHRARALDLLNQARQELLQAEQAGQPSPGQTMRPN